MGNGRLVYLFVLNSTSANQDHSGRCVISGDVFQQVLALDALDIFFLKLNKEKTSRVYLSKNGQRKRSAFISDGVKIIMKNFG